MSDEVARRPELLALDFDGTLVGKSLAITTRVRDAVHAAQDAGVRVAICTGRMFCAIRPYLAELRVVDPVVCYQGAAVFDAVSGEMLFAEPLDHETSLEALALGQAAGLSMQLYKDDRFYVEEDNAWSRLYAGVSGVPPIVVPSLREAFAGIPSMKVVAVSAPARSEAFAHELRARLGERAYVTRSNPEFVETLSPRVNKATALRFVAERLGVPLARTMAIGDSYNDVPLVAGAGFGIAMGSAPPELRAAARAIVADAEHDGVAEAIERFVLAAAVA